jgi:glycosyltransferase involved in cell wall biosynthesis
MKYLIIVPAFNEESNIEAVIDNIRQNVSFADILVVNDGSTDKTLTKALEKRVMIIDHPFNLGYGTALQTGFRFAEGRGYDFVITMDADGQHVSSSVANLVETMEKQNADVVIGSRFLGGDYEVGISKKIGIWLFSLIGEIYTGLKITDPTSGFQLLKRGVFSYLSEGDNYPLDYPDVNIIMALHKKRFKVVEAPVKMIEKMRGKSMHSGLKPIAYVIRMFLAILLIWARRKGR